MKISVWLFALVSLCLSPACATDSDESPATSESAAPKMDGATAPVNTVDASPAPKQEPIPSTLGAHLDQADTGYRPRDYRPMTRDGKTIELVLRSSPPGANASIDGKTIGVTPTFWSGVADGQNHEFTFVKTGHAMARYRFVPTQSGIVHGTLKPLVKAGEAQQPGSAPLPSTAP